MASVAIYFDACGIHERDGIILYKIPLLGHDRPPKHCFLIDQDNSDANGPSCFEAFLTAPTIRRPLNYFDDADDFGGMSGDGTLENYVMPHLHRHRDYHEDRLRRVPAPFIVLPLLDG